MKLSLLRSQPPASRDGRKIPIQIGRTQPLQDERRNKPYISNAIRTTKYNVFDFLPRQLLYQFSRLANAYMLVISILQVIPGFSTTGKFTTLIPLVIFLGLIIAKEGYYDWKRYRQDVVENRRPAVVLCTASAAPSGSKAVVGEQYLDRNTTGGCEWMHTTWKDLKVGDIIWLSRDEDVPADVVLLHADGQDGFAYVETMALDGETSLKAKQRPAGLPDCSNTDHIAICDATLHVEDPNADLYRFDSKLTVDGMTMPLTLDQVICRGSTIRNTVRTLGMVINTGEECKIRMNARRETSPKKPALEHVTNKIVIFLMMYVLVSSAAASVAYVVWKGAQEQFAWYLSDTVIPFADIFVGFIIMFNNVIPLSLYVGLEAIKLGQMSLISGDLEMYHEETDTPAGVNTTNNLDDLGQISYVFSDKTGTLTENIMKLRMISIAGTSWLHRTDTSKEQESPITTNDASTHEMLEFIRSRPDSPFAARAMRYILAMALCHTCLPERMEDGQMDFQASSPDELALVRGARDLGFIVTHRNSQSVSVQMPNQDGSSSSTVYEIMDVIEFSSKRKRMTIVVRCPDGRPWLICKGADSIMLPRLRMAPADMTGKNDGMGAVLRGTRMSSSNWASPRQPQKLGETIDEVEERASSMYSHASLPTSESWIPLRTQPLRPEGSSEGFPERHRQWSVLESSDFSDEAQIIRQCFAHIDHYATEGLRTLVYADKFLDIDEYENWKRLYREAETSLDGRQERIEEVSELLEQSLDLVGASAVEDKLQAGVPETIAKLRQAGIKIWMLTGDKRETAINIAHSTRICGADTSIYVLDIHEGDLELQLSNIADAVQYRVDPVYSDLSQSHTAVVIDGETLTSIENPSSERLTRLFASVLTIVDSVICCRASPAQKAYLVNMIRKNPATKRSGFLSWFMPRPAKPLTLAIGDGANDLAMISAANVGVGISGREGQQAARLADFSISKFRFLSRLVLVHGRWNYYRTTRFILATFWKETFIYFPQALFQTQTGATGTSLYEPGSLTFVSFFTAATMLIIGTWEQDLHSRTLMVIPELFQYGQKAQGLNSMIYLRWFGNAIFTGMIVYAGCWAGYADSELIDDAGLYAQGFLTFVVCVIWINIKLL
ncbi:hypothetical protein Daus18300_010260 [Diaporthe australafricana]|uniref:Phospholipid-transporting ATPase n=1 Tax=Diaporthe australafricana TaxID=127596 RepID=A0ABR3WB42_9PEZI